MTLIDLLGGGAEKGLEILDGFEPAMKRNEYLTFMNDQENLLLWPDQEA